MPHRINKKCTNCHACLPVCPTQSVFVGQGQYVIDTDTCEDCAVCFQVCPSEAITLIPLPKKDEKGNIIEDEEQEEEEG